jgi:release factor glutamine methyltransferase
MEALEKKSFLNRSEGENAVCDVRIVQQNARVAGLGWQFYNPPTMAISTEVWTVKRLLEWTTGFFTRKQIDSPRLSAEMLLSHVLQLARIQLYTNFERPLGEKELTAFRALVQRASEQEPIAYLTGRAGFFSLEFEVNRQVLIPRPETETLVENVVQFARHAPGFESPRVLDLCTGSGCVACAIASVIKTAMVLAVDISPAAVEVAKRNVERLKLSERVTVEQGDLFEPVMRQVDKAPYHFIVANPPYVPTAQIAELDRNVREYEPHQALDGGADGLDIHRRILGGAIDRLEPNGRVYMEIAFDQGEKALAMAADFPAFEDARLIRDLGGRDRVLTLKRK